MTTKAGCYCPAAPSWRKKIPAGDDQYVLDKLRWSWSNQRLGPPSKRNYHDWTHLRAITLRETRRRKLKVPAATLTLLAKHGVRP